MSELGYFTLAFAALVASGACFAVAIVFLGSIIAWTSSMSARIETLLARGTWMCVALGCALIATACVMVLVHPVSLGAYS